MPLEDTTESLSTRGRLACPVYVRLRFSDQACTRQTNVVADALTRRAIHSMDVANVWVHTVASTVFSIGDPGLIDGSEPATQPTRRPPQSIRSASAGNR